MYYCKSSPSGVAVEQVWVKSWSHSMDLPSRHCTKSRQLYLKAIKQDFPRMLLSHKMWVTTKKCSFHPSAHGIHQPGPRGSERHASVQLRNRMWLKNMYFTNLLFNSIMSSNSFVQRLVGRILMQCCVFLPIVAPVLNVTYPITHNHCWMFLNTRHRYEHCPVCPHRRGHNTHTHIHKPTLATAS